MYGDSELKEVRFDIWCQKCRHRNKNEAQDPCNECLEVGMREGSEKPENWEENW